MINLNSTLVLSEMDGPEVIDGLGSNFVDIDGNEAVEDFFVQPKVTATLFDLSITNGVAGFEGGGIDNEGTLTVNACTISDNTAGEDGGGICNHGTLIVTESFLATNTAAADGGGISNKFNGDPNNPNTVAVSESCIVANTAGANGGGIANSSIFNICNTTILSNSAVDGGGIANAGELRAVNVSIVNNQASDAGGGLDDLGDSTTLENSIVSMNGSSDDTSDDIGGLVSSASEFNLVDSEGSGSLITGVNGNLVGFPVGLVLVYSGVNSNPGANLIIGIGPGSAAIDRGSNALAVDPATGQPLTTDERGPGFTRISGGTVDIGAYEFQPSVVAGVSVKWGTQGRSSLQTAADGTRLLPAGRKTDLPWMGISQIQITLNQVATLTAADITVQGAKRNYGPVTISRSGLNYTITLARPITTADRVTITIAGTSIVAYSRRLDILPGDFTDDGSVNSKDIKGVQNQVKRKGGASPTIFGDVLGDGTVDAKDSKAENRLVGRKLPKVGGKVPKAVAARGLVRRHGHGSAGVIAQRLFISPASLVEPPA